ncbi:hypothetical protein HNR39_003629 [Glaciimonas immobilis]|uniref:Uncharacterized protein n=1 Tax=Glaciimonas immobilis TaxID=728004 RepID=A0A840RZ49_9BURK|nr:hypothetical protein [Glaciimonas immobilis]
MLPFDRNLKITMPLSPPQNIDAKLKNVRYDYNYRFRTLVPKINTDQHVTPQSAANAPKHSDPFYDAVFLR